VDKSSLPKQRQLPGAGNRKIAPVRHRINKRALIKVSLSDILIKEKLFVSVGLIRKIN